MIELNATGSPKNFTAESGVNTVYTLKIKG